MLHDYLWCKIERATFRGAWNLLVGVGLSLVSMLIGLAIALFLPLPYSEMMKAMAALVALWWLLAGAFHCIKERHEYAVWVKRGKPR